MLTQTMDYEKEMMLLDEDTQIQVWLDYLSNLPQDKKNFYDDF